MKTRHGFNRWVAAFGTLLLLGVTQTALAQTAQASLKYPNISHVLKQAFSAGVQVNRLK